MRLPVIDGRRDRIDVPQATEMLYYALDHGVNYVDTAWTYHGASFVAPGNSEVFLGNALAGGYRDRVLVATKLPPSQVKAREDMDAILAGQLERLRTDHVDCYLLHGLDANTWAQMYGLGALEFLDAAKAEAGSAMPGSRSTTSSPYSRPSSMLTTGTSARSSTTTWTPSSRRGAPVWPMRQRGVWASSSWSL